MPNALRFKSVLLLFYSNTKCSILRPVHRKKTVVLVFRAGWLLPKLKLPSQRSLAQQLQKKKSQADRLQERVEEASKELADAIDTLS